MTNQFQLTDDQLAIQEDLALGRIDFSDKRPHECRLACPVATHESHPVAWLHAEAGPVDEDSGAGFDLEVAHDQHRNGSPGGNGVFDRAALGIRLMRG